MERLELNFRAEPAPVSRASISRGWWLWCLVSLFIGLSAWWYAREFLTQRLSDQLASAQSPSEAFLALEGLLKLNSDAALEIVRGLQHPNSQVARTAYRTLDAQITGWQQLESSTAVARMRSLSQRLTELPESTPADNLVLASSLASRIFAICLELDDPQLKPIMTLCEKTFLRVGKSQVAIIPSETDLGTSWDIAQLLPPPSPQRTDASLLLPSSDHQRAPPSEFDPRNVAAGEVDPRSQLNPQTHSLTSNPSASFQFLTSAKLPRAPSIKQGGAVMSLSDGHSSSISISDSELIREGESTIESEFISDGESTIDDEIIGDNELIGDEEGSDASSPDLIRGPARVEEQPLMRVNKLALNVDLSGIEALQMEQLVRLLGSMQPQVAQAAALALYSKGFSDDQLELACELATGAASRRLELIQQVAVQTEFDPRPWLLWMAEEGEPEVKRQAVGLLSSMSDISVQRDLRRLLGKETDESVAQSIRQVLLSGPRLQLR